MGHFSGSPAMSSSRVCFLLVACTAISSGLRLTSLATTRRGLLSFAPVAAMAPILSAHAVGDNKVGYACGGDESCGMSDSKTRAFTESSVAGKAGIRIGGTYTDPLHPGCQHKILLQGGGAIITGADEDGKKFKLKGVVNGKAVYIDFTPKGGPTNVRAEWTGIGLQFADGNVWTKLL